MCYFLQIFDVFTEAPVAKAKEKAEPKKGKHI